MRDERLWTLVLTCRTCGKEINRAEHVPTHHRTRVALAGAFFTCEEPSHNTFSDLNLSANTTWTEETAQSGAEAPDEVAS